MSSENLKKEKKCQPAAGDLPDLIQTEHVPSSRLAWPKKSTEREKKSNRKSNYLSSNNKKVNKCQPAAGDRPDLIQTEPKKLKKCSKPCAPPRHRMNLLKPSQLKLHIYLFCIVLIDSLIPAEWILKTSLEIKESQGKQSENINWKYNYIFPTGWMEV